MRFLTYTQTPPTLLVIALLRVSYLRSVFAVPYPARPLAIRQSSLDNLALPDCALQCFLVSLTNDGCETETDFKCHCQKGLILSSAASCLKSKCESADREKAVQQVASGCNSVGVDIGGGDDNGSTSTSTDDNPSLTVGPSSTDASKASTTQENSPSNAAAPTSSTFDSSTPTSDPASGPTNPVEPTTSHTDPSQGVGTTTSTRSNLPSSPTNTPLALLPTDRQLSSGAKAGISVSVTVLAATVLITLFLYIRRLKAELRAAQAAAGVPESVWRAHISTVAAPAPISRRRSWRERMGRSPPGSPGSPGDMHERMDGSAVLKKKRGNVLSVVVEGVEEDETASMERMVHEPVPGQKEGLVDPLELDGEYTGLVELPTSVTPRTRSRERSRDRGSSLGEASRPSTSERGRWLER
ncbi:hypothetical protein K491DRAFT_718842 [Lophiostoma macrostomum CBS 122681]|uniref:CFEM domain-containing protein n=1 Tax=Lophiostoma macrostomum CBS 122681 TaxID=1314788 RepID=A0A6A6SZR4_9PLEO|nr:hypothetical protein K491DRAFT_718842 [Lophiostoma macrostomum CBS 122681]